MGRYMDWRNLKEDLTTAIGMAVILLMIILPPLLVGIGFWIWLSPVGFWQLLVCFIFDSLFVAFLYGVEILIIIIVFD